MSSSIYDDSGKLLLLPIQLWRFGQRTEITDSCWNWTGHKTPEGYGIYADRAVHRIAYELHRGKIEEDGMHVDHVCFNPSCVNPDHLRLLTASENTSRTRRSIRTHCARGHEYDDPLRHVGQKRVCRICLRERTKANRAKQLEALARQEVKTGTRIRIRRVTEEAPAIDPFSLAPAPEIAAFTGLTRDNLYKIRAGEHTISPERYEQLLEAATKIKEAKEAA